jgi:hypothetical protein
VFCAILIAACNDEDSTSVVENAEIIDYLQDNGVSDSNFINCILDNHPQLTVSEIDAVIELNCNHGIYNIKGIEIFSNLEDIQLTGNHIAQVDFSSLPRLQSIHIENDDSTIDIVTSTDNAIEYVYLENLLISEFSLSDYPNLTSLYLLSLNLNVFEANSNAFIEEINISDSVLPSMILSFLKVRKLTISNSTTSQLILSNIFFSEYLSSINSNIGQLTLSEVGFTKLVDFNGSSINTLTLNNVNYVQTANFSNNQIQTLDLETVVHVGSLSFAGNPLLPETQAYLDSLTDLNVIY